MAQKKRSSRSRCYSLCRKSWLLTLLLTKKIGAGHLNTIFFFFCGGGGGFKQTNLQQVKWPGAPHGGGESKQTNLQQFKWPGATHGGGGAVEASN